MEKIIKIILAALLLLCLAKMPYGYYQIVRFTGLIGFAILAYKSNERQENIMTIIYVALAVLFQPLFKISLGRELWNIIDVIVAVGLFISIFIDKRSNSL